ncbi:hypothetical protein D8674_011073 [Pyrus ussuriensis x Pyrus communis]|uniref:Uncharacterized protein n=1 Tax=Pyrus ussuriensis x Pyrus communis TaxID=2448454 RepID=A0A5N5FXP6_9ROSA|nr:hypothetical protein D8674_011073 [Pyrus ussuriensis x Pyrus communis]
MQLITVTLSTTAVSCIIGSISSNEMWMNLKERFSFVTKASIFQLKTEHQNIKKDARDHLAAAGVVFEDDDIIILALKGLTTEYNNIRCIFLSQLLAKEATINQSLESNLSFGTAMMAANQTSKGKALVLDSNSLDSCNYGSSSRGGSNQHNSSNSQSYYSGNQHSYNSGNYNGGYSKGYRGNNYKGKGRGKFNYNSGSRFHTLNNNPILLGAPKPYQSTCQRFAGNLSIQLFNAITKGLHTKEGLMHLHSMQCMLIITLQLHQINFGLLTLGQPLI